MDNFYTDLIAPCKFVLFMTFTRENRQLYYTGLLINSFILCYIMDLIRAQGVNVIIDLEPTLYPGIALSLSTFALCHGRGSVHYLLELFIKMYQCQGGEQALILLSRQYWCEMMETLDAVISGGTHSHCLYRFLRTIATSWLTSLPDVRTLY